MAGEASAQQLDLRSLASFRMLLALLLLIDLASRARLLSANYTDAAAHARSAALAYYALDELPSLSMLAGSTRIALALFLAAGVAAVLLGIGWRTRIATVVAWVLLDSLHSHHALLLDGGDHVLRCLPTLSGRSGFLAIGLASWVGAALVDVAIAAALR